ncbi:Tim44/TimA family putative adaptor protein [Sphingomonas sp.]|uniref:Tim44/TimA family putative adaptor protein n=1 Tax=Sphingomonas sp. TaxID=28214 RepID=UPI001DC332EE|nr:Tim44/TimA family putative adaptor protein [Sphingomonas sp.]MBX9797164.1 Tim44/TimA family putative adaptor protein [Sphingomonas sp.]
MLYLVLLAMIAGFLALQLYRVLGKRTGHEPLPRPAEERMPMPPLPRTVEPAAEPRDTGPRAFDSGAEQGLRAIVSADPGFDVARFVDGAKVAYKMIIEAFWKGDAETLAWLCEDGVRESFAAAIAEREEAGHVLDNRLVSIERAQIVEARVDGRVARITVRIDADIAAVTRDRDGAVVAGSLTDAVTSHELWTFTRTLKSGDQNWKLAETDDA